MTSHERTSTTRGPRSLLSRWLAFLVLPMIIAVAFATPARAVTYCYTAALAAQPAGPGCTATVTPATGSGTFVLDTSAHTFAYDVTFSGLLGSEIAAHIHSAAPTACGGIIIPAAGSLPAGSPKIGVYSPTTGGAETAIIAGMSYINIHSTVFGGGEIRGQLVAVACPPMPTPTVTPTPTAGCAFQHPSGAGKFAALFVQAFVSCGNVGGNSPNSNAGGGAAPACKPPETYAEQAGSPAGTWTWATKSVAAVSLKSVKQAPPIPVVSPADSSDVRVALKGAGLEYSPGVPVNSASGVLSTVTRATFNDRASGDVTVVDFPVNFPLNVVNGKVKLKTTADTQLNADTLAGLPHCTSLETVQLTIIDENGNAFGNTGIFNP